MLIKEEVRKGNYSELYVEVRDTGIGIREEDIDGMFESFRRLDEKRNRNIEGTGLGMSIVTKLLEMMGSKLELQSVYGEGSSFYFRLNQEIVSTEPMGKFESIMELELKGNYSGRHLYSPMANVLVVDGNTMNLKVAENFLRLFGIRADVADSSEKCLAIVRKKVYDVILLDLHMEGMDGFEILSRLKNNSKSREIPVIFLTADDDSETETKALSAGAMDFVKKPFYSFCTSQEGQEYNRVYAPADRSQKGSSANDKTDYI